MCTCVHAYMHNPIQCIQCIQSIQDIMNPPFLPLHNNQSVKTAPKLIRRRPRKGLIPPQKTGLIRTLHVPSVLHPSNHSPIAIGNGADPG